MKIGFLYYKVKLKLLYLLMMLWGVLAGCKPETNPRTGPIAPEDALSTFELESGFKIELVAAEPLVSDPVDMEIDEYGRLYVLEMHGYPLDKSGTGQVKLLTDTDGDGSMDESIVFADGFTLPFGVMRWKNGILVTDAPDIIYLEDTTGDGVSDIRKTVLTGFALSNPQMDVSNPIYGLDNWIYLTSESGGTYQVYKKEFGDLGGDIYFPDQPDAPRLPLIGGGRTVRFRPDQYQIETTSGKTQFGHAFDAWGHHLLGNNSNHIYHEVIAAHYLKRNPDLLVSSASQPISDHGSAAEVFPITQNPEHQLLTNVGVMTSACGNTAYLGGAFSAPYGDHTTFVAEPVSNIIHADHLENQGASFTASRLHPTKEFLASTDAWFRPVNMYVGPDGALYVADFYRQIIEHPEWMSEEAIQAATLYNGKDRGRIYRISATDAGAAEWTKGLQLGDASSQQLVEKLASPNIWWRINAQRLLVDRADRQVVPDLVKMAGNSPAAMGRLHALWALEGLRALDPASIKVALKDTVAGIRENAIKLAELHLSDMPELADAILPLQNDEDPKVRFQLLCTLGFLDTPQAAEARNKLLFKDLDDEWVQIAALSATSSQTASLLKGVLDNYKPEVAAYNSLVQRLTSIIGASGEPATIHQLIQKALAQPKKQQEWKAPILNGLAQGLENRESKSDIAEREQNLLVSTFFDHPSPQVRNGAFQILKAVGIQSETLAKTSIEKATSMTTDEYLSDERRVEAVNFISLHDPAPYASLLKDLMIAQKHPSVQLAALNILSTIPDQTVADYTLAKWSTLTPEIRDAALNTFLYNPDRVRLLLNALDEGKVSQSNVNFYQRVRLMTQSDEQLRTRARTMFSKDDKDKVNQAYQQSLQLKGNEAEGKTVYAKNCALCHQVKGELGIAFGPDLGTVHSWQSEAIMAHILDPNLSIAVGYDLWKVDLNNGEAEQGIISSETPAAITLKKSPGVEKIINRQNIKSLNTLNMSAMPTGLEKQISQQEMADLLAYLRQNK